MDSLLQTKVSARSHLRDPAVTAVITYIIHKPNSLLSLSIHGINTIRRDIAGCSQHLIGNSSITLSRMAKLLDLPFEMLSITAADLGLTNRARKQARLACRKLADIMTPVIFRRAYISRIRADRDAFMSLAATPYLAAHVEEIIWFELGR